MWLEIMRSERNLKRDEVILVSGCGCLRISAYSPTEGRVLC